MFINLGVFQIANSFIILAEGMMINFPPHLNF